MTSDSSSSSAGPLVLITGITGFLAQHVLRSVLAAPENYRVRGTVRSLAKSKSLIYDHLPSARAARDKERVELVEVPDTASSDLSAALEGVEYVLHVASPYVIANITDPKEQLLKPAVDGTLNVLRYAKESKSIKRIGITSSFAAVTDFSKGGPNRPGFTYTAQDWQPFGEKEALEQGGAIAYSVSKKLAEKAAWDFVKENKGKIGWDLFTINPPMIYGPSTPWVTKKSLNTSSGAIYNVSTTCFLHASVLMPAQAVLTSAHRPMASTRRAFPAHLLAPRAARRPPAALLPRVGRRRRARRAAAQGRRGRLEALPALRRRVQLGARRFAHRRALPRPARAAAQGMGAGGAQGRRGLCEARLHGRGDATRAHV